MHVEEIAVPDVSTTCALPIFITRLPAGFPSPADDYIEGKLDLNTYLVRHEAATFFVKVTGDSMTGAGIHSGDILVVDRSLEAVDGKVVVAVLDGELTVKRLSRCGQTVRLLPANPAYDPIDVTDEQEFSIWGVVTSAIHPL